MMHTQRRSFVYFLQILLMSGLAFCGSRATSLRNRLEDQVWERRLGVNTCGNVEIHQPGCHLYGTFSYSWLMKILDRLEWRPNDVFVDIGCGKGRVLCCAAMFKPTSIVGIDLDKRLCEIARQNVAHMRGRKSSIEVVHAKAQDYDYHECTKLFLFNPFGGEIFQQVLTSIEQSIVNNPRQVEIVYLNPVHEELLERSTQFERFDRWLASPWSGLKHNVSFWRNAGHRAQWRPLTA
jgi:precorrin-6B methylase 2